MSESRIELTALKEAIELIGSQSAMARLLEVSQPTVSDWVNRMMRLPAEHVLAVEGATGISRHDLRPDIYPREEGPRAPAGGRIATSPAGGSTGDAREDLQS